jgi:hypothetical protein
MRSAGVGPRNGGICPGKNFFGRGLGVGGKVLTRSVPNGNSTTQPNTHK